MDPVSTTTSSECRPWWSETPWVTFTVPTLFLLGLPSYICARFTGRLNASQPSPLLKRLRLRALGLLHCADFVIERLEVDYPVVLHPELLFRAREIDVLGGETQEPSVRVDRLVPFRLPAYDINPEA